MNIQSLGFIKKALPVGSKFRRVPNGLAAGCMMEVDFHSSVRQYFGVYELEIAPSFRRLLHHGMKTFDIGGQNGYYALSAAKRTGAEVVSFECDPRAAERMRRVFSRNPALQIKTVVAYVGAEVSEGFTSIDEAARTYFVPDFIKMDIEGAEDMALAGAKETLKNHHPSMIIEVHAPEKEAFCIDLLRGVGYQVKIIDQNPLFRDSFRKRFNRWLEAQYLPA